MNFTPEQITAILTGLTALVTAISYLLHGHIQTGVGAVKTALTPKPKPVPPTPLTEADVARIVAEALKARETPPTTGTSVTTPTEHPKPSV